MQRAEKLMAALGLAAGQAILIHKPSNVFYLSGYAGEGLLVIAKGVHSIVTDFRYVEQAEQQAPGWQVLSIRPGISHISLVAQRLAEAGVTELLFEEDQVTVSQHKAMLAAMPQVALSPLNGAPEKLRQLKDQDELACIRRACQISCQAFDWLLGAIKPGIIEKVLQRQLDFKLLELGADGIAFSSIVASGPNGSLPHAVPGDRQLQNGDMITFDFGASYGGYCSDMTRTVALGEPGEQLRRIYGIVQRAQSMAQEAIRPGADGKAIDAIARDYIAAEGYGPHFGHGLGHGVGIDIHEEPRFSPTADATLAAGMVMTVEPGIYVPGLGGVRIENSCLVTDSGVESLITATRELVIL